MGRYVVSSVVYAYFVVGGGKRKSICSTGTLQEEK